MLHLNKISKNLKFTYSLLYKSHTHTLDIPTPIDMLALGKYARQAKKGLRVAQKHRKKVQRGVKEAQKIYAQNKPLINQVRGDASRAIKWARGPPRLPPALPPGGFGGYPIPPWGYGPPPMMMPPPRIGGGEDYSGGCGCGAPHAHTSHGAEEEEAAEYTDNSDVEQEDMSEVDEPPQTRSSTRAQQQAPRSSGRRQQASRTSATASGRRRRPGAFLWIDDNLNRLR